MTVKNQIERVERAVEKARLNRGIKVPPYSPEAERLCHRVLFERDDMTDEEMERFKELFETSV